jgi:hypothetical protein
MPTFTQQDLLNLASQCDDLADAVPLDSFKDINERSNLFKRAQSLRSCAFDLRTAAATIVVANTDIAIKDLSDKTKDVIAVINTLKDITKALAVLDDVIILATAVASQKWGQLKPAADRLQQDIAA